MFVDGVFLSVVAGHSASNNCNDSCSVLVDV